ncbi:MAG: hypothetical protein CVU38_04630 [Chloroflexi bacterium HGW-Chloroflexi-1]|nr:MAG: hypothetical protein CVU38_04630 [Chloroflexi bacterium HGW-Chloroflexi-1]
MHIGQQNTWTSGDIQSFNNSSLWWVEGFNLEAQMSDQMIEPVRIDRLLTGQQITVGGRTIQPVARAGGWYGGSQTEGGGGAAAWVHMTPVEVVVHEPNGAKRHVATPDTTRQAIRGIVAAGLVVAGVCLGIMLAVNRVRLGRRPQ